MARNVIPYKLFIRSGLCHPTYFSLGQLSISCSDASDL